MGPLAPKTRAVLAATTITVLLATAGAADARGGGSGPPPGSPPLPRPPWTTNLFYGDHASFDHSTGGWTASHGSRVMHVPEPHASGSGALALTNFTRHFGTMYASSGHDRATYTKAVAGNRYAFNFWVRGSTENRDVAGELTFLDARGRHLADVVGMQVQEFTDRWVHITNTSAIAPPTTSYVVAHAVTYKVAPGETQFIDSASLQRAPGGAKNVVGPLHTSGNRIIDGTGHPLTLRGFNRVGMQGGPVYSVPTSHEVAQAKLWGANVIRLAVGEQKWPGLPQNSCHVDPTYPSQVDKAVNLITGMHMYVVLELHWVTIAACGPANSYPMPDCNVGACNALAFWTAVANRYKSNPLVGFDVFNEPHDVSEAVWRNGGAASWHGVNYTAAGMQQMYNSVRATGASNLVFVTGLQWGNVFPPHGPISGNNIVYSVHSYTCPGAPPPHCITPSPQAYDGSYFLKHWVTPGKSYPVFVAEWGWPQPGNSRYAQSLLTYAEAQHWGWAEFTWGDNANSRFDLIVNRSAGSTFEPAAGAMPALDTFPGG